MQEKIKKVKLYIKKRKIKTSRLALKMDYHPSTISKLLTGHYPLSSQFFKLLLFTLKEISHEKIAESQDDIMELKKINEEKN